MSEIWDTRFSHAILKVERAHKHISDAQERIITATNAYQASFHIDSEARKQFIYYFPSDRAVRRDLALITGDAIHNLRSALDIAWMAILERNFPHAFDPKHNKFPFKKNRKELETVLTESRKIAPTTDLFRVMVEKIQPYEGGDYDLFALHYLDIDDKHRLLIPVSNIGSICGVKLENESGEIEVLDFVVTHTHMPERIEIPFGSKIKDYGKVSLSIAFGEAGFLQHAELVPTLIQIGTKVETIVRAFQRYR